MGTLYDINKVAVLKEKPYSKKRIELYLRNIGIFFLEKKDRYFMLLNRERYDFTLFDFGKYKNEDLILTKGIQDLKECLQNRGKIVSIEQVDDSSYEIWIINGDEAFVYYLFPYEKGVIFYE